MSNWAKLQEDLTGLKVVKRAKHGIHFDKGNGEVLANFSGKPCHFLDAGIWKPIDTKLLALGDGYYGCPHSKVKIKPDGTVAVAGTDYVQRVELTSAQTGLLDGDKMVRKFSFGEQRMWVTEDGFRSEIQLNRIPTLTEARKLIASESGTLSKEYLKSLTTAEDAKGNVHTITTLAAFRTWLAGAAFPVVIDPDFTATNANGHVGGQNATYSTANTTSAAEWTDFGTATCGQQWTGKVFKCSRLYFPFDTSSIGAGSTVTQVNLKFTCQRDDSGTDFDAQIVKWSGGATREARFDNIFNDAADDSIWRNSSGIATNTPYTSGNLSTAWVNKTGTTNYALRSSRDKASTEPSGLESLEIYGAKYSTAGYRPTLTVTYTAGGSIIPIVQYYNRLRRN